MGTTPVHVPDGVYSIINPAHDLVVNSDNDETKRVTGRTAKVDEAFLQQYWMIKSIGEDIYTIRNIQTGEYLYLSSPDDKTPVTLAAHVEDNSRGVWRIVKKEGVLTENELGTVALQNEHAHEVHIHSGFLDLKDGGNEQGTIIQGYQDNQGIAQDWTLQLHSIRSSGVAEIVLTDAALSKTKLFNLLPKTTYLQIPGEMFQYIRDHSESFKALRPKKGVFGGDAIAIAYKDLCNQWASKHIEVDGLTLLMGIAFNTDPAPGGPAQSAKFGYWILSKDVKRVQWINGDTFKVLGNVGGMFDAAIY